MDNRFGFKELVICVLLVGVIVSVWLAMMQYDRQWEKVRLLETQLSQQAAGQARIQRQLGETLVAVERLAERPAESPALMREMAEVRLMLTQLAEQGADAAKLAEQLEALQQRMREIEAQGPAGAGGETSSGAAGAYEGEDLDPFARIKRAQQMPGYAQGDWLVGSFAVIPDRLTPLVSSDVYSSMIQGHVLEALLSRDPDTLEWTPMLARRWAVEDNSDAWQAYMDRMKARGASAAEIAADPERPHAARIVFDLRRGVTFSDGEPLTADDVVFTFNWMMNPEVEAPRQRAYYEKIERVEKLDDHRVAFEFREPYFEALELAGTMAILPEHFYSRFSPSEFNRSTGLLLGSGPYRLPDPEAWRPEPGKPIELVRNERYWGEPGGFNKLVWQVIAEETARLTTFRNGDIDSFFAQPEQYESLRDDPRIQARAQRFEFQAPTAGYIYIGWNQRRNGQPTRFADKRVRQAMTMLTDRARIVSEMYKGYGQVVTGPFSPLTPQSDKTIEPWPFDPARARALLAEAGYEDRNGDGVLESADGQPFRFELNYPANSDTFSRVALFIKDTYARAGVVVDLKPLEWSVLLDRLKNTRDFDAVSLGWSGSIEGDPYQIFHSSQIPPPSDNSTSYANPELDALIEQARATLDEEERMPLWHRVHRILHEDQPYTFLFTRKTLAFYDKRIRNIHETATGLSPELEWFVPSAEQKWTK